MKIFAPIAKSEKEPDPRVLWLYFFSGLAALVYELCFIKTFSVIFGGTSQSMSAVLAAFMGGMSLGSLIGGRLADRGRNPLRLFGIMEGLIGLYCFLVPLILATLGSHFPAMVESLLPGNSFIEGPGLTILRISISAGILLVPTTMMGCTFPLISKSVVAAREDSGRYLGYLYAANTFGATAGILLSTYFLIFLLGISLTFRVTALVNGAIFLATLIITRGQPLERAVPEIGPEQAPAESGQGSARFLAIALIGAFGSGFSSFLYEVGWNHALQRIVGSSIYSLGIILATVLLGMAIGSWLLRTRLGRSPNLLRWLAFLQFGLGGAVAVSFPFWDRLPSIFVIAGRHFLGFGSYQLAVFLVCAAVLIVPCILLGIQFPLLLHAGIAHLGKLGTRVGFLTFVNTLGAIIGSLVTGFVLISLIGSERTIAAGVAINFGLGVVFLWGLNKNFSVFSRLAVTILVAAAGIGWLKFTPHWDPARMNSGSHVYLSKAFSYDRLLYQGEDINGGFTSVIEKGKVRTMLSNGKFQGDNDEEVSDNKLCARAPMLINPEAKRVLVIGLGPGITADAFLRYPLQKLDIAEFSPRVVEAARDFFGDVNRLVFTDPRVTIYNQDGRFLLAMSRQPYDVISIQVSSVWIAGASNIYSRDFYRLCRKKLSPNGVLQQWIQFHHMSVEDMVRIIQSMRSEFEYVSFWMGPHQGVLVASGAPQVFSAGDIAEQTAYLAKKGGLDDLALPDLRLLLGNLMLDPSATDKFLQSLAGEMNVKLADYISDDDHPVLEYTTPLSNLEHFAIFRNKALLEYFRIKELPKFSGLNSTYQRHILMVFRDIQREQYGLALYELQQALVDADTLEEKNQVGGLESKVRALIEEKEQ